MRIKPTALMAAAVSTGLLAAAARAGVPELVNLGSLSQSVSVAWGVNADGTVVVGQSDAVGGPHAFRWTQATGMVDLGVFPGTPTSVMASSIGRGVSADGSLVTGSAGHPLGNHAFRWSQAGGMLDLGLLGTAPDASATGISADGLHICGKSQAPSFRWTDNGAGGGTMEPIAPLPGLTSSWAQAISGDGRVVVGYCTDTSGSNRAFRWISDGAGGGTLHAITGTPLQSLTYAYATNSTGSVVVGLSAGAVANTARPFRWVANGATTGTVQILGVLAGQSTGQAMGVSGDGTVVVGYSGTFAFVWTRTLGLQNLNTYLASLGVDLTGWNLRSAYAVSSDGTAIVGNGSFNGNSRAFLVRGLPAICVPLAEVAAPGSAVVCPAGSGMFRVWTDGSAPTSYQWQIQTAPGVWATMGNDPMPLPCGGGAFAHASPLNSPSVTIGVRPCPGTAGAAQQFQIRCIVQNACGSATSGVSTYTVCPADFDCSGRLGVQDIFAFLQSWFANAAGADFNGDAQNSVQDIFDYLAAWFVGCG